KPLDPSREEIRLIGFAPSDPRDKSAVISCTLHTKSLFDKAYFVAVSYVWGNPEPTTEILVNGAPFQTTVDFAAALGQAVVWTPVTAEGRLSLRFLADAICISQQDTQEKNHQIPLMRDI
ncbi:hypothetical protein N657DRAFT_569338, partial [Parathielavia appendiculata]